MFRLVTMNKKQPGNIDYTSIITMKLTDDKSKHEMVVEEGLPDEAASIV